MTTILRVLVGGFQNIDMDVVKRMYLALVLFTLLKETNLWSVAEKFQLSRGFIQVLLSSSSAFCSCVLHFTEVRASNFRAHFGPVEMNGASFAPVSRSWRSSGPSELC